jgi:hypothetical protein
MGGCRIKGLITGSYAVKAGKAGYGMQTASFFVNAGELTKEDIELVKQ